ncbi:MAG: glutamate racemase [Clostridia bacterium]|nr:glutamate racemase [Clostridia bacterium]
MNNAPIGVFDSGLGGLTAVKELHRLLPDENIVYFGDTGRVPYGNRSRDTIRRYAEQDMKFLLSQGVKMVIAACGTVSSVAADIGAALPVPYTGVVRPAAKAAVSATKSGRIGVIGTSATISSGTYRRFIGELAPDAQIFEQDCPLFVPLVENGFVGTQEEIVRLVVEHYLAPLKECDIDTLILGCTHYPILSEAIGRFMPQAKLIDVGAATARYAAEILRENDMLCEGVGGGHKFYVSDRTEGFSHLAGIFLGEDIDGDVVRVDIDSV